MPDAPSPKRTGTIHRYAAPRPGDQLGHYVVRCSAPDGTRPLFHLDPGPESPKDEAVARQTAEDITAELWRTNQGAAPRRDARRREVPRDAAVLATARAMELAVVSGWNEAASAAGADVGEKTR